MSHLTNKISVIIPVYNAQDFIEKGVLSALQQNETAEVILIEDGSTDNSLSVCKRLAQKHERVKLYTHPDNQNLGVSVSRNLGIKMAKYPFIAFLDADDFFLENRFKITQAVFKKYPNALGVYESNNTFITQEGEKQVVKNNHRFDHTMKKGIKPEDLFEELVTGDGHFLPSTITLNRQLLLNTNILFHPELVSGEDSDFFRNLSLVGDLYPGSIDRPVVTRVIHQNNHIHQTAFVRKKLLLLDKIWIKKSLKNNWSKEVNTHFLLHLLECRYGHISNRPIRLFRKAIYLAFFILKHPKILKKIV